MLVSVDEMSAGLQSLVDLLIRNSADVLRDSEADMFPAFMLSKVLPSPSAISMVEFRPLTEAARVARETARDLAKDMGAYVVAWDGYVHIGEDRTDAFLLEAWEQSTDKAILLAHRYSRKPFQFVGSLIRLDGAF